MDSSHGGPGLYRAEAAPAAQVGATPAVSGLMPPAATDHTLLGQVSASALGVARAAVRLAQDQELSEEQVERLMLDLHRLVGMAAGLPTGGAEQAVRVTAGLAGEPLGRQLPKSALPPPRRRREMVYECVCS